MKNLNKYLLLLFTLVLVACVDEYELGTPPTATDAVFTKQPQEQNPNYITFSNTSSAFMKKWDFGNGSSAEGNNVTAYYPFEGEYTVTLTVFTSGGSTTSSEVITVDQTDPEICNVEILKLLTGGCDAAEGKTWVIDAGRAGHFGVGPATPEVGGPTYTPDWYQAAANEKEGGGMYDDEYTFFLNQSQYVQETNGDVYLNGAQASNFAGATESPVGDYTAPYTAPENMSYSLSEDDEGNYFITLTNGGFIGYATGVNKYQILSITEDEMFIRFRDAAEPILAWYHRLIRKGYTPDPPPPPATTSLPVDFEGEVPPFNGFGGSVYQVVDNPNASGINTSAKVGEYVKGTDGNWAGIETTLDSKIDFTTNTLIKYKVYSPVTGKALFKLESADGSATPVEVFADITKTNEWEELIFDFSAATTDTYDKIAVFLDFDNNNGGTFYIDDIRQAAEEAVLTEADLTGGASKIWMLKSAAGAFGVGPEKGSDAWWPNGADISGDRPCLFNDQYIFKTGGEYEYNAQGDFYGEAYMGVADGCQDESNLTGTDAEPWSSGVHAFNFTPATETDPAYITVTGTGAFIALPKAFNGGEYDAAPPTTDGAVTYEVLSYVNNGTSETLNLTIDISGDGTAFWNFTLMAQ